jgi:hypothetical protein
MILFGFKVTYSHNLKMFLNDTFVRDDVFVASLESDGRFPARQRGRAAGGRRQTADGRWRTAGDTWRGLPRLTSHLYICMGYIIEHAVSVPLPQRDANPANVLNSVEPRQNHRHQRY